MGGTRVGGLQAARTNKERYNDDYYRVIGTKGGLVRVCKGFGKNRELATVVGAKGGAISRRDRHSIKQPKERQCTYCAEKSHYAYACELRQQILAARRVREVQAEYDRDKNRSIAEKWAKKR